MKKTLLITAGILLILIIGGIWTYLLIFGVPRDGAVFANFGRGSDESNTDSALTQNDIDTGTVDTSLIGTDGTSQALRQLTTRPVVGAVFIGNTIRYMERGTGHIYDIALSSGEESLLSGTTMPQVTRALFSFNGNRVATISETDGENEVSIGTITKGDAGEGALDGINLPTGAREVGWSDSGDEIFYLQDEGGGTIGYAYHITEKINRQLFRIPLRDVRVLWGAKTYVYTTPSAEQTGYIYEVAENGLKYVANGELGLMGTSYDRGVVLSYVQDSSVHSLALDSEGIHLIPIRMFPEKCIKDTATSSLICAEPLSLPQGAYPDDWYKGAVSLSDLLWHVDIRSGEAQLLSGLGSESGREIDVSSIGINDDGTLIWFINKNDDTLWMFDTLVRQN